MSPSAQAADTPKPARRRRRAILLALIPLALLLAGMLLMLRPSTLADIALKQLGAATGLEIQAASARYGLGATPYISLDDVSARATGSAKPLFQARRVYLAVPWKTLRRRGQVLDIERIELDAPSLDLAALQSWQQSRPASAAETRLPTLLRGLGIREGRVQGEGWRVENLQADIPHFAPDAPLQAALQGRSLTGSTRLDFDLNLALSKAAISTGLGVSGQLEVADATWRLPARIRLRAHLHQQDGHLILERARLSTALQYLPEDGAPLALAFGAYGRLHWASGTITAEPLAIAIRGQASIPDFSAYGRLALDENLHLALQGELPHWPSSWPALPAPLHASRSPLPFAIGYQGDADFSAPLDLQLRRDDSHLEARLRIRQMQAWLAQDAHSSPLPPLQGKVSTPRLIVEGAVLEGVEIGIEDPSLSP
ncbi:hypothetical protein CO610_07175 [Lysobacteraceae bacterium NML95-0200]|nr:hypothetical protein CO610_07175 [Xanthomonadaceae bacterium NML95-0200]